MDESFLTDLLECSVCLEQLDGSSRVLPCQHTFCRRCLVEIVQSKGELRCPECRVLVHCRVDDLPLNILLVRLLEGIKNKQPRTSGNNVVPPATAQGLPFASFSANACSSSAANNTSGMFRITHYPQNRMGQQHQQQQQHHHYHPMQTAIAPRSSIVANSMIANTATHLVGSTPNRQLAPSLPCARVLYNYDAKDPGDLSIKKGDLVILRKRVDPNWYQGELNGMTGFVPATYLQVMVPLPTMQPQCKALYDFKLTDQEEKDCLTFAKGELIQVIRRVDENWAEGKMADRIGIFPISFVEMNAAAKAMMKFSQAQPQAGPARLAPPTPNGDTATTSITTPTATSFIASSVNVTMNMGQHSVTVAPSVGNGMTSSSGSLLTGGSVSSASSQMSTSGFASFPSTPGVATSVMNSASGTQPQSSLMSTSGFASTSSASPAGVVNSASQSASPLLSTSGFVPSSASGTTPLSLLFLPSSAGGSGGGDAGKSGTGSSLCLLESPSLPTSSASAQNSPSKIPTPTSTSSKFLDASVTLSRSSARRHSSRHGRPISTGDSTSKEQPIYTSLPVFYVALYNYKPQKSDELELRKSELYTVSEKCQDGWYKGTCFRTGQSGVFPGNYVQPAAKSTPATYQTVTSPASRIPAPSSPRPRSALLCSNTDWSSPATAAAANGGGVFLAGTTMRASDWSVQQPISMQLSNYAVTPLKTPLLQHGTAATPVRGGGGPFGSGNNSCSAPVVSATANNPWFPLNGGSAATATSSVAGDLFTALPAVPSSSMATLMTSSLLGNTGPLNSAAATTAVSSSSSAAANKDQNGKNKESRQHISLMKRLTGSGKSKSRSPPPATTAATTANDSFTPDLLLGSVVHVRSGSCPSTEPGSSGSGTTSGSSMVPLHKKTASLDDTLRSTTTGNEGPMQPTPLVRERYRCIVPYPPNSEFELELKVGDVVYVHKKREDGWYKGTLQRSGRTALFPGSFVEPF